MSFLNKSSAFRVAIVGRPNVGKSSLFNFLTRSRSAVVKDQPGVTRDILTGHADWWGKTFEVLDTGGLTTHDDEFSPLIYKQVLSVLKYVDLLIIMLDAKSGLLPEDQDIIRIAKEAGRPFFAVVNKVDRANDADLLLAEFHELGVEMLPCSVERRERTDEVIQKIIEHMPETTAAQMEGIRITIIGKPNVGKSSICNAILGEKRVIVSEIAGTTIDAVEIPFAHKGDQLILIDTAGLRRQNQRLGRGDHVEIISAYKSKAAIEKADVVLLVIDATIGPTEQDAKMIDFCMANGKAILLVANKMDLADKEHDAARDQFRAKMNKEFHFETGLPVVFTSAVNHRGIDKMLDKAVDIKRRMEIRIPTKKLNDFFYNVIRQAPSPVYRATNVKFYYITQTEQKPPSFIAFANHPDGVTPAYKRFLVKRIREEWDLEGMPIRIFVMKSN